ncbi:hypothetical protein B0H14DRAFT_2804118 [Mycena olivaceomarginata]|nr:hypothetical protein B0H14DRAFT_2804118 [Mycena olivaceomarginata]
MDATLYSERLTVSPRGLGKSVTLNLARAPDAIKAKRFANKNTALVQFFPGGEYAWLAPTRVTHLSVTQIEEYVANSRHKKPQLVNGYRKAAERAKDNRQIAPPNLKGKRSKWGGGGGEIFPIGASVFVMLLPPLNADSRRKQYDNNKGKHQARAGEQEHRLLPEEYRPPAISANLGVVPVVFAQSIHLGPGGPVFCSDIAMTFELSPNARIFGPTTLQSDADLLLAFFQGHGGVRHFEYICYAHAMLGVVEEGLSHRNGNVKPKIEGSMLLGMVFQYVGDDPRAFGHATLRGDGDAVLAFLRSQSPGQSQYICYLRLILEYVAKGLGGHK